MTERLWSRDSGTALPQVIEDTLSRARAAGYDPSRVVAIHIHGCADAYGTDRVGAMRRSAHAHTSPRDSQRGTICFKGGEARMTRRLVAHEVAHILTYAGHTKKWGQAVTDLGHPAETRHVRGKRPPATWYWHDRTTGEQRSGTHREMVEATR